MSKPFVFNDNTYLLFMGTCYKERMDFLNCMKLGIYDQNSRTKKGTRCKEYFDKYITCTKENENDVTN